MNRFAFVNHYLDARLLRKYLKLSWIERFSEDAIKKIIAHMPPYRYMSIGPIKSITGTQATGIGIACPLLPEQFITLKPERVFKKILSSVKIGERFGAKIIGLGGFTSVFGNEGEEVARQTKIAVTSGNTYTAALAIQGLLKAAELMGLCVKECKLAVIGATGDIGSICTKILAKKVKEVVLAARNEKRLSEFAFDLQRSTSAHIRVTKYISDAVRGANLILSATSAITTIIEPNELKSGSVICDVAYPANITRDIWRFRNDVLAFEGGLATWMNYNALKEKNKLQEFSPPSTIHGCLAETILLTLEGMFVNFSLGRGQITEQNIETVNNLAQKHGFDIAPFYCGDMLYTAEKIEKIKQSVRIEKKSGSCGSVSIGYLPIVWNHPGQ